MFLPDGEVFKVKSVMIDPVFVSSLMKRRKVTIEAVTMEAKAEVKRTLNSPTLSSMKDKLIRHRIRTRQDTRH